MRPSPCAAEGPHDAAEIARRLGRGHDEGGQRGRAQSRAKTRSTTRCPDDPIGRGSGSSAAAGSLVGVDQVRRLDEHQRDPAAGRDQLAPDIGAVDPDVDEDVGRRRRRRRASRTIRRPGVGTARRCPPVGPRRSPRARTAAGGRCRRACGGSSASIHGRSSTTDTIGCCPRPRARAGRGWRGRWRTVRPPRRRRLDGEGRAERRRPRPGPGRLEPAEKPVEQRGEARPAHLDLGLDAREPDDPGPGHPRR